MNSHAGWRADHGFLHPRSNAQVLRTCLQRTIPFDLDFGLGDWILHCRLDTVRPGAVAYLRVLAALAVADRRGLGSHVRAPVSMPIANLLLLAIASSTEDFLSYVWKHTVSSLIGHVKL